MSQTNLPYVNILSCGFSDAYMKAIVSVPLTSLIPCSNRPRSFANAFSQIGLRSGRWSSCLYSSCCPVAISVIGYALLILGRGVAKSWYACSSWVTCGGACARGLCHGTNLPSFVMIGCRVVSCCTLGSGTLGVGCSGAGRGGTLVFGCSGAGRGGTLGVGSIRVSCIAFAGAISSKMAAYLFIACILSAPGCLNGVVGVGCFSELARSNAVMVAASALGMSGIFQCWGKKATVSLILPCPVVDQYT
jgi:hypothetical protein